jgi:Pyruvate-formate lyase-activating enzyme
MLFEAIRPQLEMLKKVGGITFSGGEPLLQADAVADLAKRCKQIGINIAIETSGVIAVKELKKVLPYVDTWLIGMRLTTGHSSSISPLLERKVRRTLKCLQANTQNNIIVRIPVIPGYTSTLSYLQAAQNIVKDFSLTNIELLPQNPEGEHYYKAAGLNPLVSFNKHEAEESYQYATNFFLNNKLS